MEMKMVILWALFGLIFIGSEGSNAVNDITCGQAFVELSPCQSYLVGNSATPTAACCLGVAKVNQQANTTQIRRQLCGCFKAAAARIGVKADKAKQLPSLCHVQVPVTIDPNVDCNSIKA